MSQKPLAFWSLSGTEMLQQLQAAKEGLTADKAGQRLRRYGSNLLKPPKRSDVPTLLIAQFKSPLILILFFATGLSFFLHASYTNPTLVPACTGPRARGN